MPNKTQTTCCESSPLSFKDGSLVPVGTKWSKTSVLVSVRNNEHVSVDGSPPVMTLVHGIKDYDTVTFTLACLAVLVKGVMMSVCYLSHKVNGVTYYVTARDDQQVVLQEGTCDPVVSVTDARLFEMFARDKGWYQFRSFTNKDLFLTHDGRGLCLKTMSSSDQQQFDFDLFHLSNT
ncbi:uncharacterized protein LOC124110899 [Haliotis rufescens]|uniref:uncharacterized protein LOC124110899 n=1 Tax=Haliotis rufescens TaxID=6454 RepID=UPI001EB0738E|nr:uncharacterized protein LOC124110899 [Haliotis rufescens]